MDAFVRVCTSRSSWTLDILQYGTYTGRDSWNLPSEADDPTLHAAQKHVVVDLATRNDLGHFRPFDNHSIVARGVFPTSVAADFFSHDSRTLPSLRPCIVLEPPPTSSDVPNAEWSAARRATLIGLEASETSGYHFRVHCWGFSSWRKFTSGVQRT